MIRITPHMAIAEKEIQEEFIHASGPGGQNVNKVATAVQLRFDVAHSPSLTERVRSRLTQLAGTRINSDGILIIEARRFRSQERNRRDALERLVSLLRQAAAKPKARRKTKPTLTSQKKRLATKRHKSRIKQLRGPIRKEE